MALSMCSETVEHLFGRDSPTGWTAFPAVTRRHPIGRINFNYFDIGRNLTQCTYIHSTDMILVPMYA